MPKKALKKEFPFKVGADPEFCILMQNNGMSAVETIPYLIDGKKYRRKDMGYEIPGKGNIGWDGCNTTGEIRPLPSNKPEEVIDNIRGLFEAIVQKTQIFSLSTLSKSEVVGGHIHLEVKRMDMMDAKMKRVNRIMSTFYLPILMGENTLNVKERLRRNYGRIYDYRMQDINNTISTYEFRAPTAEWLTTPKLAQATLAYLGVVFHEVMNNPKSLSKLKSILFTTTDQSVKVQELTVTKFAPMIKILTKTIRQAVRTFELYPNFQDEIEYLFNFDRVLKDKAKVDYNIITGWEMEKIAPRINKRTLLSDKAVKERSLTNDIDEISELIPIRHSQDLNMMHFAMALKQRILVFNWRLKNNYYFFGLRNNIKNPIVATFNGNSINDIKFLTGHEQIKFQDDKSTCLELIVRMFQRTNGGGSTDKAMSLVFGIPYKDRVNLNIKNFIKLLYDIEHDKLKPVDVPAVAPNIVDTKTGNYIPGELAAILSQSRPDNPNRSEEDLLRRAAQVRLRSADRLSRNSDGEELDDNLEDLFGEDEDHDSEGTPDDEDYEENDEDSHAEDSNKYTEYGRWLRDHCFRRHHNN